ncbi:hypothetical protein OVA24_16270 [Luteolibacter sp. SL250]|uniref:hypothetical protein n=1 Tax=Luteolibacter sp. SL250 TaxID=2995170 RepID=UPI00226D94CD|nr:hypothetical protein [Luteolibacter sp. SL250]WAC18786.1 hypothetical protein OVA24_16270 [Luteolibacter sp. SL250]
MPQWIRERFPPDQRSAVDHLRSLIDEGMLREIAEADYARDAEQHLAALKPIRNGDELRELHYWFPDEVLRLIRWSEPEDPEWKPGSTGLRGHKMRAFSCAVLLAVPNFEPDKETLIQLVDSVFLLGPGALEATAGFLVWRLDTLGREEDRPFFALALAAVAQSLEDSISSSMEQELADWVTHEESSERAYLASFCDSYRTAPWLFGLSFSDMRNNKWEMLIRAVRERSGPRPLGRMLTENHKA